MKMKTKPSPESESEDEIEIISVTSSTPAILETEISRRSGRIKAEKTYTKGES